MAEDGTDLWKFLERSLMPYSETTVIGSSLGHDALSYGVYSVGFTVTGFLKP